MVTNYFFFGGGVADVEINRLHSLLWRSETECNIAFFL